MPRKDTINRFDLQESGDFTWWVSDCENFGVVTHW